MIFQYAHLLRGSIRLVRFHPNSTPSSIQLILEHQERYYEKNVHYTALAYKIGDRSGDMKDITLQGRTKLVPESLWRALSTLVEHHDTSGRFWIEYVCVNQRDDAERVAHSENLSGIYASAEEVWLWLEMKKLVAGATLEERTRPDSTRSLDFETIFISLLSAESIKSTMERLHLQQAKKVILFSEYASLDARRLDSCSAAL